MQRLTSASAGVFLTVLSAYAQPGGSPPRPPEARVLDSFDSPDGWAVVTSEAVNLKISPDRVGAAKALRLDYDFTRGSGYAIIRKTFDLPLPDNYRFTFNIRGQGPRNTLEFKLLDDTLDNVWWLNQPNFNFPAEFATVTIPRRKISFAWGPSHGQTPLKAAHAVEFVITSFNGGKGTVWLDEFRFEPLPVPAPPSAPPAVTVSSTARDTVPPQVLASDGSLGWFSASADARPTCTITYPEPRDLGGLILTWGKDAHPSAYTVELSSDGAAFAPAATVAKTDGGHDYLVIPDAIAKAVRITAAAPGKTVAIERVRVMPPEFADTRNAVITAAAADAPFGFYPRAFRNQATYWTIAGVSGDDQEILVSQDGAVEVTKEGFSIEPFIITDAGIKTFADAEITQSLQDGYLPVPGVTWTLGNLTLAMTFATEGAVGDARMLARYTLTNTGAEPRRGRLALAIRPFQVNPPYQWLNTLGGVGRIDRIERSKTSVTVDGTEIVPLTPPAAFAAVPFEQGEIVHHLAAGTLPTSTSTSDPTGLASAALVYDFTLAPGQNLTVPLIAGLHKQPVAAQSAGTTLAAFDKRLGDAAAVWRGPLAGVDIRLPASQQRLVDTVRANLAYILINRDGAAIHPGSRSYERAWIRDGSLTSAALLAFGCFDEAKAFADWFGPYQYDNGKVPCCVDRRGPDPVPEHDSHGQYIWLVRNVFEHTGDSDFLARHYPRVLKAVEYIKFLRDQRNTPEYQEATGLKAAKRGILPESISHEGYSAKPMHSYWDNFFAARGLNDAAHLADLMGDSNNAAGIRLVAGAFRRSLYDSLVVAMSYAEIDYLPGCVELGDFDATSTTVALWPCNLRGTIPEDELVRTFDRAWQFFQDRASGAKPWDNYTPYEHRTVGAMIMLGHRDRAHTMWDWFFTHQRPPAWRHWGEVVWNDPKTNKFIGDMPHTWCGSDFINAFRTMFAYDRADASVVLGAGLPRSWASEGVSVKNLITSAGPLEFTMTAAPNNTVRYTLGKGLRIPPTGLYLSPDQADRITSITINSAAAERPTDGLIPIPQLPATIDVTY